MLVVILIILKHSEPFRAIPSYSEHSEPFQAIPTFLDGAELEQKKTYSVFDITQGTPNAFLTASSALAVLGITFC